MLLRHVVREIGFRGDAGRNVAALAAASCKLVSHSSYVCRSPDVGNVEVWDLVKGVTKEGVVLDHPELAQAWCC
jgi:hypothetical protein